MKLDELRKNLQHAPAKEPERLPDVVLEHEDGNCPRCGGRGVVVLRVGITTLMSGDMETTAACEMCDGSGLALGPTRKLTARPSAKAASGMDEEVKRALDEALEDRWAPDSEGEE